MLLTIDNLKQAGAFTGRPIKREVSWMNGDQELKFDVYVRPLSYYSAVSDLLAIRGSGDSTAGRIASCICDENGIPVFKQEDVTGIKPDGSPVMWINPETGEEEPRGPMSDNLTMALLTVIGEVNRSGKSTS